MTLREWAEQPRCQNCGYETADLKEFKELLLGPLPKPVYLCRICSSTNLCRPMELSVDHDIAELYRAVAWIGNMLVDEIRNAKSNGQNAS